MSLQFFIQREYGFDAESVYLVDKDKRLYYTTDKDGNFVENEHKELEQVLPLFRVTGRFDREDWKDQLLNALTENGAKLPEKQYVEGRLEQMEKHLEDMRTLVFKPTTKDTK